jgi:hypothetical protein
MEAEEVDPAAMDYREHPIVDTTLRRGASTRPCSRSYDTELERIPLRPRWLDGRVVRWP